jgi:6-phosphofructo-2-kinase
MAPPGKLNPPRPPEITTVKDVVTLTLPSPSVVEVAVSSSPQSTIVPSVSSPGERDPPSSLNLKIVPPGMLPPPAILESHSPIGRKQSQHSSIARTVMAPPRISRTQSQREQELRLPEIAQSRSDTPLGNTPLGTAPNSPRIRATTIDVPGLTKSKVSPDGRIANRDLGSKLVIVMVGLPARGKSYVTKKLARYLNWLQHDTRIFNVGNRRRLAAGAIEGTAGRQPAPQGTGLLSPKTYMSLNSVSDTGVKSHKRSVSVDIDGIDQSAAFFDPKNTAAAQLREKVALETLDELLNYVLYDGGSVGILDATNSTLSRRKAVLDRIRQVAGNEIGVVFLESVCNDQKLLEANMRLKLQGPDYKETDPVKALADFKLRVKMYESTYETLGEYEERLGMQYIKMIDVGRKVVSHQIRGFLAAQTVYFLLNFHLSPRQIWITRHGESMDNIAGKIGGDASLSRKGKKYAKVLANFVEFQRRLFHERELQKHSTCHLPPQAGDSTPPNPAYSSSSNEDEEGRPLEKNFCVWTSMLKRSVETAECFDEEVYDLKEMRMLNELNAGIAEGLTYEEIESQMPKEFEQRKLDKLRYRYPGAGGESYLDVINRLRPIIVEVERMKDHVLLVAHRVVARVLLAYFLGLKREYVAKLDVPIGMLFKLEPRPYGVEFKAYRYNEDTEWFDWLEDYQLMDDEQKIVEITY